MRGKKKHNLQRGRRHSARDGRRYDRIQKSRSGVNLLSPLFILWGQMMKSSNCGKIESNQKNKKKSGMDMNIAAGGGQ